MPYITRYGRGGVELPGRGFVTGAYYAPAMTSTDATMSLTLNTEYAARFDVGETHTFVEIGLEVTTGAASAVVRLGIRANDSATGCYPGALILDAGTISAVGTGYQGVVISQALAPGRYWVTAALQTASGVSVRGRSLDPFIGQTVTSSASVGGYTQTGVSGALPATWSATPATAAGVKVLLKA